MLHGRSEPYARVMSWLRRWWAQTAPTAILAPSDPARPDTEGPRTARDWSADAGAFVIAVALGALILSVTVDDTANRMTPGQVATDAAFGALCCLSLWWRRRWPFGVALVCVLLGAFSTFASGASSGLRALGDSLAFSGAAQIDEVGASRLYAKVRRAQRSSGCECSGSALRYCAA